MNVTGNTYNSALTVTVVCAGVVLSGCLEAGELLLGSREGVHLDPGPGARREASSHHDPVLKSNGTSPAGSKDSININNKYLQ